MSERPVYLYIFHADLDAFYASVERLDDPGLEAKPVAVGGSVSGRGVVASASYEARQFGVKSAMPMRTAFRMCPELVQIPPRFDRYHQKSEEVMGVFHDLTPLVEPISMDEAFLDVSEQARPETVDGVAEQLKGTVWRQTGLTITVGGGTSKVVAKIASQVAKPDGIRLVKPGEESEFLAPLDVEMLWGIGPKSGAVLKEHDIKTIGDLANVDAGWLQRTFGKRGPELKERAYGIDDSPVTTDHETKSVSAEGTTAEDIGDPSLIREEMTDRCRSVGKRLQVEGLKGKTVFIKLRLADFTTFTRQTTLAIPTDDEKTIFRTVWELTERELSPRRKFRLFGAGVTNFQTSFQLELVPPA